MRKRGSESPNWRGTGKISSLLWNGIKGTALKRGWKFEITILDAWNQFQKQQGLCALTGIPLDLSTFEGHLSERTASLDRIDSQRGYEPGNIQWVYKSINLMKNNFLEADFIYWCRLVANHMGGLDAKPTEYSS
jgi:hypothetical protein